MSTRKLKRNISNDPNNDLSLKKPKLRKPLQLQHTYAYETPHPTASSQSEVYKLPSSVGERMSPSNFSPIPKAPQIIAKTSSTNLKENASAASPFRKDRHPIIKKKYTTKKKNTTQTRALESPLYPSSPAVISSRDGTYESSPEQPMTFAQNPESPPTLYKPKSIARRPSAPTPPRKSDWKELKVGIPTNGSAVDLLHDDKNDTDTRISLFTAATSPEEVFHRAPNHSPINFNRPPSQLSLYDYNRSITYSPQQGGDGFFSNIRGESTPFNTIRSPLRSPSWATRFFRDGGITAISDTDTDSDSSGGGGGVLDDSDSDFDMETGKSDSIFSSLKKASRARARSHGSGYVTPSEDDDEGSEQPSRVPRSPWIDDSLISAPDTRDWRLLPRSARSPRYMRGEKELKKDVDMEKSILEGMFESLLIGLLFSSGPNSSD
ncbi:hypothetical protein L218DRAFT_750604 [Marasmius fiardii PR-910]|nr:hypothetical protein L218DRAFT_750604 [Marasmius fiardii PR-910]